MTADHTPDERHAQERDAAIKRLKARREFRTHLFTYVVVNLLLVGIWALSGAGYFWPVWAIGGWGIGLAFHAWDTFGEREISEDDIADEIERRRD